MGFLRNLPPAAALSGELHRRAPGESVLVLVTSTGLVWSSRFPSLWFLPALYMDELRSGAPTRFHDPSAMSPQERYLGEALVEDKERRPPDVLAELRPGPDRRAFDIRSLDYLGYFSLDPRFRAVSARYAFAGDVGEYRLYRLGGAGGQVPDTTASESEPAPGGRPIPPPGEHI